MSTRASTRAATLTQQANRARLRNRVAFANIERIENDGWECANWRASSLRGIEGLEIRIEARWYRAFATNAGPEGAPYERVYAPTWACLILGPSYKPHDITTWTPNGRMVSRNPHSLPPLEERKSMVRFLLHNEEVRMAVIGFISMTDEGEGDVSPHMPKTYAYIRDLMQARRWHDALRKPDKKPRCCPSCCRPGRASPSTSRPAT